MKKIQTALSLIFMLLITQVFAQEKNNNERSTIAIEIIQKGKIEKGVGYL